MCDKDTERPVDDQHRCVCVCIRLCYAFSTSSLFVFPCRIVDKSKESLEEEEKKKEGRNGSSSNSNRSWLTVWKMALLLIGPPHLDSSSDTWTRFPSSPLTADPYYSSRRKTSLFRQFYFFLIWKWPSWSQITKSTDWPTLFSDFNDCSSSYINYSVPCKRQSAFLIWSDPTAAARWWMDVDVWWDDPCHSLSPSSSLLLQQHHRQSLFLPRILLIQYTALSYQHSTTCKRKRHTTHINQGELPFALLLSWSSSSSF